MDTVVLTIDNPPRTTKHQRTLGEIVVRLLTFWIPRASPDYETNLDHIKYWYIEVDKTSGVPQREIGFGNISRAILFAPTEKHYGLWTDSSVKFTWTEHTTVDKEVFNDIFEALEKHDFKVIENKIKKYKKLWTENPEIKIPELPVLICNLDSMTDFLHCKTYEQLLDVDVMGYEWEEQKLIDKTGAVYTTDYINFGHPVGCVIPKKIEIILSFDNLKKKAAEKLKKSEIEIKDSKTFEQLFELMGKVS